MHTLRMLSVVSVITLLLVLVAGIAPGEAESAKTVVSAQMIEEILAATPDPSGQAGRFPVPMIYTEWTTEVVERFGDLSLATHQRHLLEDLPPARALGSPIPVNEVLSKLLADNPEHAAAIIAAALGSEPARPQWSIIAACGTLSREHMTPELRTALLRIAAEDPDLTDRAFALRELARHPSFELRPLLIDTVFGDSQSLRLLALELLSNLGHSSCDAAVMMPISPLNSFHYLFTEHALERLLPDQEPAAFFSLPMAERRRLVESSKAKAVDTLLELARERQGQAFASMVLLVLGDDDEQMQSLRALEKILLDQGRQPSVYHSPAFWLRVQIVGSLKSLDTVIKRVLIADRFAFHLARHTKEREMLLLTLAYALNEPISDEAEQALAQVRSLETDNLDLYHAAAMSLAGMKSKQAFPSLLHIASQKKQPFATIAFRTLESLTGLETPGRPVELGVLHNVGVPQDRWDLDAAFDFWQDWYDQNQESMVFDSQRGRFTVAAAKEQPSAQ